MFASVRHSDLGDLACSIARPVSLLGDRWTFMILRDAFSGVRRFDQFQQRLGISRPLLAERLARLVDAEVLELRPYADPRRTRHEYWLTEKGLDLYPVLVSLRAFADKHMSPDGPVVLSGAQGLRRVDRAAPDLGRLRRGSRRTRRRRPARSRRIARITARIGCYGIAGL